MNFNILIFKYIIGHSGRPFLYINHKMFFLFLFIYKLYPNVKFSAFPETTYKLHGTLRIQEVNAVSAKDSKTAWRRYSKHVIIYVFKPRFLTGLKVQNSMVTHS